MSETNHKLFVRGVGFHSGDVIMMIIWNVWVIYSEVCVLIFTHRGSSCSQRNLPLTTHPKKCISRQIPSLYVCVKEFRRTFLRRRNVFQPLTEALCVCVCDFFSSFGHI